MATEKTTTMEDVPSASKIEKVSGVSIDSSTGSYVYTQSKTLEQMMVYFMEWWSLVQALIRTSDNTDDTKTSSQSDNNNISAASKNNYNTKTIIAKVSLGVTTDYLGHITKHGMTCPECGKNVESLQIGGFCSAACATEYIAKQVLSYSRKPSEKYKEFHETLDQINGILNHTTLILNALVGIPNIIRELSSIEEPYKSWVDAKINEGYCCLHAQISKLMGKKDQLIGKLLKKIRFGIISKPLETIFGSIYVILNAIDLAQDAFDLAYETAYSAIQNLGAGQKIKAENIAWFATPHSMISNKPSADPDFGKIVISLPGGSGTKKLEIAKPLMPSAFQNINFTQINKYIDKIFVPIKPAEYYLEPELFKKRYLFSDKNKLCLQIRQQAEDYMTYQLDYLPKYENMFPVKTMTQVNDDGSEHDITIPNLSYTWFMLALLDSWAPHSMSLVGSMLNPLK